MARKWSVGAVFTALVFVTTGTALAADLPVKAPAYKAPEAVVWSPYYMVIGGSWVFSGGSATLTEKNCSPLTFIACTVPASITGNGGWGIFGGLGYRFSPLFRGEVRVGYGAATAHGDAPFPGEVVVVNGDFSSVSAMLNGYLDFAGFTAPGAFGAFEPYVGAGFGVASNRASNVRFTAAPNPGIYSVPGGTNTDFAWNVSAGTAIRLSSLGLSPNWLLDIAYRYRDLGRIKTDAGNVVNSAFGLAGPTAGFESRARGHGIDFALRYEFR